MADPLLTSLCSVCHAAPPRYRCPRCAARTCSLACVTKHKGWASCSGVRNAAAYVPLARLQTPAGIDHDYNFLSAIERARDRAEKVLVEERALVTPDELRRPTAAAAAAATTTDDNRTCFRPGRSGAKRPWSSSAGPADEPDGPHGFDKRVRRRLRELDIEARVMPAGMSRSRENKTTWNRANHVVNWQVEWLVLAHAVDEDAAEKLPAASRMAGKVFDSKPLHAAFSESLGSYRVRERKDTAEEDPAEHGHSKRRRKKKGRRGAVAVRDEAFGQSSASTWTRPAACSVQQWQTCTWVTPEKDCSVSEVACSEAVGFQFYLADPVASSGCSKVLIQLQPDDTLATALTGRTILEYPTIYVLPTGGDLPHNFSKGSTARRKKRKLDEADRTEFPAPNGDQAHRPGRGSIQKRDANPRQWGKQRQGRSVSFAVLPPAEEAEEGEVNEEEGELNGGQGGLGGDDGHTASDIDDPKGDHSFEKMPQAQPRPIGTGLVDYGSSESEETA